MGEWHHITYLGGGLTRLLWPRALCRRGWHLFDEYATTRGEGVWVHKLVCDKCDLEILLAAAPKEDE